MESPVSRASKAEVVSDFRRAQILEAARQSFARHGLGATTVDDIARAAHVAKGTVYLYFKSKDEILRHALGEGLAALQDATIPGLAAPAPFEARLRRFLEAMLTYFEHNRGFIELCQLELNAEMRRKARQKFGRVYAAQVRAWRAAVERAMRSGEIAPANARRLALLIVSLAHGLAIQRLRGWSTGALEDDAALASALVWKGLALK
jgi:AcrR family transcriptional regulator